MRLLRDGAPAGEAVRVTLEPTSAFYEIDGAKCRVWRGHTDAGVDVSFFVVAVAAPAGDDLHELDEELIERRNVRFIGPTPEEPS